MCLIWCQGVFVQISEPCTLRGMMTNRPASMRANVLESSRAAQSPDFTTFYCRTGVMMSRQLQIAAVQIVRPPSALAGVSKKITVVPFP